MTLHVLFVCTGNICRSPIAERLAAVYAARLRVPDFRVSSAGTRAVIGNPIHDDAALVIRRFGGNTSNFAARQVTERLLSDADLILTMTRGHRDEVLERAPRLLRKTFTLAEASLLVAKFNAEGVSDLVALRPQLTPHELTDIADPIGRARAAFDAVGSQIAALLPPIVKLCQLPSVPPRNE